MKATILIVGQGCTIKERTSRLVRCRCCKYLHENGNCLKTGNFCMSVQDSDCPKIKKGESNNDSQR